KDLRKLLSYAKGNDAKINDSTRLPSFVLVNTVYETNNFQTIWSKEGKWQSISDSLYETIKHAKEYGLFPADYNYKSIEAIRSSVNIDSVSRRNAALWARADVLFTDAYFNIAKHLKLGRLERDSITLRNDSLINDAYFIQIFNDAISKENITQSLKSLEPKYPAYQNIRESIRGFLDSANFANFTYIAYPYKDSLAFIKALQQRLSEEGLIAKGVQSDTTV